MSWDLNEAMEYYARQGAPSDQSAVIALLKEIQQEQGSISAGDLARMAQRYKVKEGLFLALIRRLPGLRLGQTHVLEICGGPNCSGRGNLADLAGTLTGVTVKVVPCMRQCGKGPNIRFDGKLYNGANEALIRRLLEETQDVQ